MEQPLRWVSQYGSWGPPVTSSTLSLDTPSPTGPTASYDSSTTTKGDTEPSQYDPTEQEIVTRIFSELLRSATKDGGQKRAAGTKPPWWRDTAHEPAMFSHLNKWKHGELKDKDSGAHPLVHLAWRALAIAYQETHGRREPVSNAA